MATRPQLMQYPPLRPFQDGRGLLESRTQELDPNYYPELSQNLPGAMQQFSNLVQEEKGRLPTEQEMQQHRNHLLSRGFGVTPEGQLQDPNRLILEDNIRRASALRKNITGETEDYMDSNFYKVSDAVSDTARVVLSPLVFLKKLTGDDFRPFDMTEKVVSGYQQSMNDLYDVQKNAYALMSNANKVRMEQYEARRVQSANLDKTRAEISGNPFGLEGQELSDYQYGTVSLGLNPNDVLTRMPEIRQQRQESEGKIIRIAGSPYRFEVFNQGKEYGTKFDTENKEYKNAKQGYLKFLAAIDDKTGIGDMAAIIQFVKTLDPGSVVREGEFAIAAGSFGLFNQLLAKADSITTGAKLTDAAREEMRSLATELIQSYDPIIEARYNKYTKKLSDIGFDDVGVDHFLGDRFQPIGAMQQAPPAAMSQDELIQNEKLSEINLLMNLEDEDGG